MRSFNKLLLFIVTCLIHTHLQHTHTDKHTQKQWINHAQGSARVALSKDQVKYMSKLSYNLDNDFKKPIFLIKPQNLSGYRKLRNNKTQLFLQPKKHFGYSVYNIFNEKNRVSSGFIVFHIYGSLLYFKLGRG